MPDPSYPNRRPRADGPLDQRTRGVRVTYTIHSEPVWFKTSTRALQAALVGSCNTRG